MLQQRIKDDPYKLDRMKQIKEEKVTEEYKKKTFFLVRDFGKELEEKEEKQK